MEQLDISVLNNRFLHTLYDNYDTVYVADYDDNTVYLFDDTSDDINLYNPGISLTDYISIRADIYCHPDDRNIFYQTFSHKAVKDAFNAGVISLTPRIRIRQSAQASCEYHWHAYKCDFFINNNGHLMMLAYAKDIHEQLLTTSEHSSILQGLKSIFTYTFLADFDKDTCRNMTPDSKNASENHTIAYSRSCRYLMRNYIHKDDISLFNRIFDADSVRQQLSESDHIEAELRMIIHDKIRWFRIYVIPLDARHPVQTVLIAMNDITRQRELDQKHRDVLKSACDAANKAMKAQSMFLKNMSHDIRTPMNAILGMCSMALVNLDDKEKATEYLNKASVAGKHLMKLINSILDMSQVEEQNNALHIEKTNLSYELKNIINLIKPEMDRHHHTLITDISSLDDTIVCCDFLKLQQILFNVLSNAIKYTPDNGTIIFIVNCCPTENPSVFNYEFIIKDDGIGMSEDFIENLYEPFARSSEAINQSIEGSGLGLSIVKNLVSIMNGNIYVESTPGCGTKVTLSIPMSHTMTKTFDNSSRTNLPPLNELMHSRDYSKKRILIAEDNEVNAEIIKDCLSCTGILIDHANSGLEAVRMFRSHPMNYYDLILMDIQMPYMDGYEATKTIRADEAVTNHNIPIISMTANAFLSDVRDAKAAGMNEHISKPVDLRLLFITLDKYFDNPPQVNNQH